MRMVILLQMRMEIELELNNRSQKKMLKLTTHKAPEINDSLWSDFNAFTNKLNSTDKSLEKFK
jgi:hypothetical protein